MLHPDDPQLINDENSLKLDGGEDDGVTVPRIRHGSEKDLLLILLWRCELGFLREGIAEKEERERGKLRKRIKRERYLMITIFHSLNGYMHAIYTS